MQKTIITIRFRDHVHSKTEWSRRDGGTAIVSEDGFVILTKPGSSVETVVPMSNVACLDQEYARAKPDPILKKTKAQKKRARKPAKSSEAG